MSNNFHGQVVEFRLHGGPIEQWMEIQYISIPLDRIYQVNAEAHIIDPIEKWHERSILPKVLHALEAFCNEHGVDGFESFAACCSSLADPSSALAFLPLEHPLRFLGANEFHAHIDAARALRETPVRPEGPHCVLNVRFVGVAARRLRLLLKNIVRPSSSGYHHSPSLVPSTSALVQMMPASLTSESSHRSLTSDVTGRAHSPTTDPSSAAAVHVSPDDADFDPYDHEEIAFGDFEAEEATRLFSGATAFRTAPATARSDTPFTAIRMRLGLRPFEISSRRAPTVETVHSDDTEDIDTAALPPVQQNLDDAESTVISPATMGRSQREHHGGHDELAAPLYHLEREPDRTSDLHTTAT